MISRVIRDYCCSSIHVLKEHMASFLTLKLKPAVLHK